MTSLEGSFLISNKDELGKISFTQQGSSVVLIRPYKYVTNLDVYRLINNSTVEANLTDSVLLDDFDATFIRQHKGFRLRLSIHELRRLHGLGLPEAKQIAQTGTESPAICDLKHIADDGIHEHATKIKKKKSRLEPFITRTKPLQSETETRAPFSHVLLSASNQLATSGSAASTSSSPPSVINSLEKSQIVPSSDYDKRLSRIKMYLQPTMPNAVSSTLSASAWFPSPMAYGKQAEYAKVSRRKPPVSKPILTNQITSNISSTSAPISTIVTSITSNPLVESVHDDILSMSTINCSPKPRSHRETRGRPRKVHVPLPLEVDNDANADMTEFSTSQVPFGTHKSNPFRDYKENKLILYFNLSQSSTTSSSSSQMNSTNTFHLGKIAIMEDFANAAFVCPLQVGVGPSGETVYRVGAYNESLVIVNFDNSMLLSPDTVYYDRPLKAYKLRRALHEIWNLAHAPASGNAKNCTLKEKLSERQGDLGSVYEREALRENTVDASSNAQLHMLAMTEAHTNKCSHSDSILRLPRSPSSTSSSMSPSLVSDVHSLLSPSSKKKRIGQSLESKCQSLDKLSINEKNTPILAEGNTTVPDATQTTNLSSTQSRKASSKLLMHSIPSQPQQVHPYGCSKVNDAEEIQRSNVTQQTVNSYTVTSSSVNSARSVAAHRRGITDLAVIDIPSIEISSSSTPTSGVRLVRVVKRRYSAYMNNKGKDVYLPGLFESSVEAAYCYDKIAVKILGSEAVTNFESKGQHLQHQDDTSSDFLHEVSDDRTVVNEKQSIALITPAESLRLKASLEELSTHELMSEKYSESKVKLQGLIMKKELNNSNILNRFQPIWWWEKLLSELSPQSYLQLPLSACSKKMIIGDM